MFTYRQNKLINNVSLNNSIIYAKKFNLIKIMPRSSYRKDIGVFNKIIPFFGNDMWTLYELSWLNNKGLPQVSIGKIVFNCDSKNIIESSSLQLYLSSFTQIKFNNWNEIRKILEYDLSICSESKVDVSLFRLNEIKVHSINNFSGYCIDEQDIEIEDYFINPNYLEGSVRNRIVKETLISHLFKSICPITNKSNWGSIMIYYKGPSINYASLLRYLMSFRNHSELYEQCIERIFNDISYFCNPTELTVYARYIRREGIEINSWRSNISFSPTCLRLVRQ
ncbi:NADPH-dependent 7-cyano-7-deazaguanine reductase QueF [Candidatus Pantoea edessiphila]|uniref:NADPH-dependent 7-cyano-7-deazaguanine reductase QueF n=1 Tax=Candidatus Pantoea edessiphila TaxID=2044610 RepID=A0A2P5T1J0_9GAMM|nr:NADPH-dependent 7-cyano-7-deazaguanine reductase QueF [Candidatus Pantoea edessiphila]PPI88455.1 NADPH-dependent 7-cyano-7-deazaguanine reductase QueF [Candidatus Pantoea edessiphila]